MSKNTGLFSLLLISTALVPAAAHAQSAPASGGTAPTTPTGPPAEASPAVPDQGPGNPTASAPQAGDTPAAQAPDVSIPGGAGPSTEVVVRGQRSNIVRTTPQITTVLSSADIARTGEGNIAGALSRVTGLSVVGNGLVYVRGLGDRYSLALLNGSPLPSPEPLRRVIPLDLFPTSVIASSLVQKSYSANFPGEFGGGVINLTTLSSPRESFLTIGGSIGGDSETTGRLGYTYFGSKSDSTGFDNGTRNYQPALASFFASGQRVTDQSVDQQALATNLATARNSLVQRDRHVPPNYGATLTGGTSFDLGDTRLGVTATAGYSNRELTRETLQQSPNNAELTAFNSNFNRVISDNRIVVNGLLGLGLDFDPDNKMRLTTLFIRDTLKQTRLGLGQREITFSGADFIQQDTAWYERQLFNTQLASDFKLGKFSLNLRSGFAASHREAPYEFDYIYFRSNRAGDPLGSYFINRLNRQQGQADVAFSDLTEHLYSAGADLSYAVTPQVTATIGYALSDAVRDSTRRDFQFNPSAPLPDGVTFLRPDYLLQPSVIDAFNIGLIETTESAPAFRAKLRTEAGYAQVQAEITSSLRLNAGARFERGNESVQPLQVFTGTTVSGNLNQIKRDYVLPAATLTWQLKPGMQLRFNASKTLARPQFRELLFQLSYDPEQNRQFYGNPLLVDSQLYNAEARYEWYFAAEQRVSVSGFYKRINNPIEVYLIPSENGSINSFANAPKASLYGGEVETQKYFNLGGSLANRRAVVIANYTYTHSKLKVTADDQVPIFGTAAQPATNFFNNGAPLTGQSDHLANLQFGLEQRDHLSQQTLLLNYASKRVTGRGQRGFPDVYEYPGFRLDFVARQGVPIGKINTEVKLEVRNITGTDYAEYQQVGENRAYYNRYKLGTSASLGIGVTF
jgi:hypothetical protein